MVREQQQQQQQQRSRLVPRSATNSGTVVPFIGFSAFAGTTTNHTTATTNAASASSVRPSPVYTSLEHSDIRSALGRLRKKDAITKCKALDCLMCSSSTLTTTLPKKDAIEAMSHYAFLFHNIYPSSDSYPHNGCLIYDNNHMVRCNSIQLWSHTLPIIPKATVTLLVYSSYTEDGSTVPSSSSSSTGTPSTTTANTTTAVGAIYCSRYDPSRDVSTMATSFFQNLMMTAQGQKGNDNSSTIIIYNAIASHIVAILSIIKSPRKNNEQQQQDRYEEQMERYERIILTAIQAMTNLIKEQQQRQPLISLLQDNNNDKILWKHINNPNHDSFRNATYQLVSCCIQDSFFRALLSSHQQQQPEVGTCLITALHSEKNPSNTYLLLETVAVYTVRIITSTTYDWWWTSFSKALCKQLRHACYGCSPASLYTRVVLPFIASSTLNDITNKILASLYDGHLCVVTLQEDTAAIMIAVSECCTYVIRQRRQKRQQQTADASSVQQEDVTTGVAEDLFFKALTWYLTKYSTSDNNETNDALACQLANDVTLIYPTDREQLPQNNNLRWLEEKATSALVQLIASSDDDTSNTAMSTTSTASKLLWKSNLARLLKVIINKKKAVEVTAVKRAVLPGLLIIFNSIVSGMKKSSNPSKEDLALLIEVVNFVGIKQILGNPDDNDKDGASKLLACLESFCINDVLPWTVQLSTSTSEQHYFEEVSIKSCFILLKEALMGIDSTHTQRQLWDRFLKELLASNCQLMALSLGLDILSSTPFVYCPALETFAMDVGVVAAEDYSSKSYHDSSHELELDRFFKSCLGWSISNATNCDEFKNILVSQTVISKWIAASCTSLTAASPSFKSSSEHDDDNYVTGGGRDVLLRLLVSLVCCRQANKDFSVISYENTVQLLLEAWYRCGDVWDSHIWRSKVSDHDTVFLFVMQDVLDAAQKCLKNELLTSMVKKTSMNSHIQWARRGLKLIELQEMLILCRNNDISMMDVAVVRPLDLVGLGDAEVWKRSHTNELLSQWLTSRLLSLLEANSSNSTNKNNNRDMVLGGKTEHDASLLVLIVKACIGASQYQMSNELQVYHYFCSDQADKLLRLLGWKDGLGSEFLELCCDNIIACLVGDVAVSRQRPPNLRNLRLSIQCLDLLSSLLLGSMEPFVQLKTEACVNPFQVTTGDVYWYLLKDGDQDTARKVVITKIHDDDHPNPPYFTICFLKSESDSDDGAATSKEKQTVAGRLRRFISNPSVSLSQQRTFASRRLERLIVEKVVRPVFNDADTSVSGEELSIVIESLNIVLHRFGLLGDVGIGSTRYDVFQLISNLQKTVVRVAERQTDCYRETENDTTFIALTSDSSIDSSMIRSCERALYLLALAMGGGVLTEPSCCSFEILNFDPTPSINALGELYAIKGWQGMRNKLILSNSYEIQLEMASMMWLAIATRALVDSELLVRIATAINDISSVVFSVEDWPEKDSQYLMRYSLAMLSCIENLHQQTNNVGVADIQSLVAVSATNLIKCFIDVWDVYDCDSVKTELGEQMPIPWQAAFLQYLKHVSSTSGIPAKARKYANKLCETLFLERKRWFGYQLLRMMSVESLGIDVGDELSSRTQENFQRWSVGLPPEEVEELEEDLHLISQLIPSTLVEELAKWNEDEDVELDKVIVIGRFLSWLAFLDLLDVNSTLDARNRGAMISYVQHTHAGKHILSLSARYDSFQSYGRNNCDENWMSCTSIEQAPSALNEEQLATLVFFRSVQTLPTVVKSWWNDDCHRSLQSMVSQFVETQVSPETLRQELRRIKAAKNLGDMQVTGSTVSREVTAVYEQDEVSLQTNF